MLSQFHFPYISISHPKIKRENRKMETSSKYELFSTHGRKTSPVTSRTFLITTSNIYFVSVLWISLSHFRASAIW